MLKPALTPEFDGSLPFHAHIEALQSLLRRHQVIILCGETGSGKTTQIPKVCLLEGFGQTKMIGCTQPRRLAVRSVAHRLALELKTQVGAGVGTKVRFQDRVNPKQTTIKVMTDGILLSEIHHDPLLKGYDVIIIDEAHERTLNIDFLLGYLKTLLPKRPDLKLVITSATIETEKFSHYFGGAPVIEVSGRGYPVEIRYRPPLIDPEEDESDDELDQKNHLMKVIDELLLETHQGDILVFLPGEREIREALDNLKKRQPLHTELVPLFARLSQEEQDKIFNPSSSLRRIVLATNVAETSLTVPGIKYVIDSGLVRVKRFSQRSKIDQLLIEKNSQASAQQRAGRCGRVAPGICIRLYAEEEFAARPPFTTPEILRSSLADVILKMTFLKLGQIEAFPFIDAPSPRAIESGRQALLEIGALDAQLRLTPIGHQIARIPLDPHLARILLSAQEHQAVTEALIITSFLSFQDPRERPFEQRQQADQQHKQFAHAQSDFFTILNLWHAYLEQHSASKKQKIRWCHERFLSAKRMREWHELHHQIKRIAEGFGIAPQSTAATYEQLHRSLLSGLISQIGQWHSEQALYHGVRGIRFKVNKASSLSLKKPKWIMAAEIVDTGQLTSRVVAQIQPQWIEHHARSLIQYTLSPGEWDRQQGQAFAFESGTLYGLLVVQKRRVGLSQRQPSEAHKLLLRHACVLQEYDSQLPPFIKHNHEVIEEVALMEHKTRRQDVLIDEEAIAQLYQPLIPTNITKVQELHRWYRELSEQQKQSLLFTPEQLMKQQSITVTEALYPDTLLIADQLFNLRYRFEPLHPLDGVTLEVPLPLLMTLTETPIDWLVPGLIREKIQYLIKGLPPQIRRTLVPLPTFITAFLSQYSAKDGTLLDCLSRFIEQHYQHKPSTLTWSEIPNHLLMNISVQDDKGHELLHSRHLSELKNKLQEEIEEHKKDLDHPLLTLPEIHSWSFGELPEKVEVIKNNLCLTLYPAVVNENNHLFIRGLETPEKASSLMAEGLLCLVRLQLKTWLQGIQKNLSYSKEMALYLTRGGWQAPGNREDWLKDQWMRLLLEECLRSTTDDIRDEHAFLDLCQRIRNQLSQLIQTLNDSHRRLLHLLKLYYELCPSLSKPIFKPSLVDVEQHFQRLFHADMWHQCTLQQLSQRPRYLEGLTLRIQRCVQDGRQDQDKMKQLLPFVSQLNQYVQKHGETPDSQAFQGMIEEFCISLFAQPMKTAFPISAVRLNKFWSEHLS